MTRQSEFRLGPVGVIEGGPHPSFPVKPLARIRWAMNAPITNTAEKVLLLVLATHASPEGVAWPSIATMASCGSLSRRATVNAVQRLATAGWVVIERRSHRTSRYRPKSPSDHLCEGCRYVIPPAARVCPVCGAEGPMVVNLFP